MECHRCKHSREVKAGKFTRMNYQDTPCAACNLTECSEHTLEYDEELGEKRRAADRGGPAVDRRLQTTAFRLDQEMNGEEADEEQLPISVVREIVAALLIMPAEIRNAVCWRYAGFEYRDVAKVQNCTIAAVEVRHRRALRRWPALKALFPEKVARQAKRAESGKRDREDSGPLTMGGSQT